MIIGIIVALVALAAVYFLFIRTSTGTARVTDTRWQTQVEVLGLVSRRGEAWEDAVPSNGTIQSCSEKVRRKSDSYVSGSEEICGTPYFVDKGNGYSEKAQDCIYHVYDSFCSYTYQDWGVIGVEKQQGSDLNPVMPKTSLQPNQRLGTQTVVYNVALQDSDGKVYQYEPSSLSEYQTFNLNDEYMIEVNTLGAVLKLEKK